MSYAKVLGATNRQDGYLEGNGYLVSWCVGHLVELAPPNVYDAKYVKWSIADLPILPQKWQYLVSTSYQVDGKTGTWLPYDSEVVEGVCFFMMRNEQRRDAVSPIVVDSKGVFVTEAPNGFENVRATITEYVRRAERKQQDVTEHEKCLTNGTYERARESGTEQNYNMIDGCVNNNPKKPRVIGNRVSVLDRLHIKLENRKQKEQGQQQQQERTLKN